VIAVGETFVPSRRAVGTHQAVCSGRPRFFHRRSAAVVRNRYGLLPSSYDRSAVVDFSHPTAPAIDPTLDVIQETITPRISGQLEQGIRTSRSRIATGSAVVTGKDKMRIRFVCSKDKWWRPG